MILACRNAGAATSAGRSGLYPTVQQPLGPGLLCCTLSQAQRPVACSHPSLPTHQVCQRREVHADGEGAAEEPQARQARVQVQHQEAEVAVAQHQEAEQGQAPQQHAALCEGGRGQSGQAHAPPSGTPAPAPGDRVAQHLLGAEVEVDEDVEGLQRGAHSVDGNQGPVLLQAPIAQPAQVAVGGGGGVTCAGAPALPPPMPPQRARRGCTYLTSVVRKGRNWMCSTLRVVTIWRKSDLWDTGALGHGAWGGQGCRPRGGRTCPRTHAPSPGGAHRPVANMASEQAVQATGSSAHGSMAAPAGRTPRPGHGPAHARSKLPPPPPRV